MTKILRITGAVLAVAAIAMAAGPWGGASAPVEVQSASQPLDTTAVPAPGRAGPPTRSLEPAGSEPAAESPERPTTAPPSTSVPTDGGSQEAPAAQHTAPTDGTGGAADQQVLLDSPGAPDQPGPTIGEGGDGQVIGELTPGAGATGPGDLAAPGGPPPPSVQAPGMHIKAGVGCSIQCITSGIAHSQGVGAELVVATDTPARIWIVVWDEASGYHGMVDSGPGSTVTTFSAPFDDLAPATTYQAMAVAQDSSGFSSHASGSFTTLDRTVAISFSPVDVITWPSHLDVETSKIWVRVNGHFLSEGAWGAGIAPLTGSDRYLDLEVWIILGHTSGTFGCGGGMPSPAWEGSGSGDCYTWASATVGDPVDLDDHPTGATSWAGHTLQRTLTLPGGALPPGYGQPMNFTVPVTLDVTYG